MNKKNNMKKKELWKNICIIHQKTKKYFIFAEETEINFKTLIQPFNEIKNAFDHVVRIESVECGIQPNVDGYLLSNLDRVLCHTYRTFFDTADFLSINIREKITELLKIYDAEVIEKAIPKYYSEYRGEIIDINEKIAKIRENKDIGNNTQLIETVNKYDKKLNSLCDIYRVVKKSLPVLEELKKKLKKKQLFRDIKYIGIGIFIGLAIWFISYLILNTNNTN